MRELKKRFLLCMLFSISVSANAMSASDNEIKLKSIVVDTLQPDSLHWYLRYLNVRNYYGLTVDTFLSTIPNNPTSMFVSSCQMGKTSMYNACYLQVSYHPDIVLRIYVNNFTHLPRYSATLNWDVGLFRQENIFRISVYKDHSCINGFCRNP
jgi:hypothetical protein